MSDEFEDILAQRATVTEQPFRSDKPILGGLIVWFRSFWINIAAKWFIRPIIQQQNEFNQELVRQLREAEAQLLAQDKTITELTRQIAQLSAQSVALKKRANKDKA